MTAKFVTADGRVIYIGTFSKAIAPAIRISYMVLPDVLIESFRSRCGFLSSTVSRIDQATLNEFIQDGYFERYLNKMRKYYRQKHDLMLGVIRRWAPDFTVSGAHAGMHLLVTANNGLSASEMKLRGDGNPRLYAKGTDDQGGAHGASGASCQGPDRRIGVRRAKNR